MSYSKFDQDGGVDLDALLDELKKTTTDMPARRVTDLANRRIESLDNWVKTGKKGNIKGSEEADTAEFTTEVHVRGMVGSFAEQGVKRIHRGSHEERAVLGSVLSVDTTTHSGYCATNWKTFEQDLTPHRQKMLEELERQGLEDRSEHSCSVDFLDFVESAILDFSSPRKDCHRPDLEHESIDTLIQELGMLPPMKDSNGRNLEAQAGTVISSSHSPPSSSSCIVM